MNIIIERASLCSVDIFHSSLPCSHVVADVLGESNESRVVMCPDRTTIQSPSQGPSGGMQLPGGPASRGAEI